MLTVAVDTQVIIWNIEGKPTDGREEMPYVARKVIQHLEDGGAHLVVPTVVVAEVLCGIPVEKHAIVTKALTKNFHIQPFDLAAATLAGRIRRERYDDGTLKPYYKENPDVTKNQVTADCKIIATAHVAGANYIVSDDRKTLHNIAEGVIDTRTLTDFSFQGDLNL